MFLSTVKLALLAHTVLVTDAEVFIKGTFESNSRAYQAVMRNLASLATSKETTLKSLKANAEKLAYFNFRSNCDVFATAVWEARKRLISDMEKRQQSTEEQSGETVDVTSDSSTSSDVVKKKAAVKTKKA